MNSWLTNWEIQYALMQKLDNGKRERIDLNPRPRRHGTKIGMLIAALLSFLH